MRRAFLVATLAGGVALIVSALLIAFSDPQATGPRAAGNAGEPSIGNVRAVRDPGPGRALSSFAALARTRDYEAMWESLSAGTHGRIERAAFLDRLGPDLADGVGALDPKQSRVSLSMRTGAGLGVASLAGTRIDRDTGLSEFETYAYGLVRERGRWRPELLTDVAIELLAPDQTIPSPNAAFAVNVVASAPVIDAGLFVDGKPLAAGVEGPEPTSLRIFAEPEQTFGPGDHTVVAYVSVASVGGATPVASGWTFVGG